MQICGPRQRPSSFDYRARHARATRHPALVASHGESRPCAAEGSAKPHETLLGDRSSKRAHRTHQISESALAPYVIGR
jgi:hypothetical protein